MSNIPEDKRRKVNSTFDTKPSPGQIYTFRATLPYIKNKVVLDIGCWSGQYEKLAQSYVKKIIGIDPGKSAILFAKDQFAKNKKVSFYEGYADKLPFKDNVFDTVLLIEVIEHLPKGSEIAALKEIKRVLKRDGTLIITTPNQHFISILGDPAYFLIGHRHYSNKHLDGLVNSSGLSVVKTHTEGGFFQLLTNNMETFWKHVLRKSLDYPSWLLSALEREHKKKGFMQLQVVAHKQILSSNKRK